MVDLKCFGTSGHVVRRAASLHHRSDGGDAGDGAVGLGSIFFRPTTCYSNTHKERKVKSNNSSD